MKTYIISLSKLKNSAEHAIELKSKLKKYNIDAELFEGSYGLEVEKQYQETNRVKLLTYYNNEYFETPDTIGVKGCFDSHYRLWKLCVDLNEPIIVFEDDVKLYRGFTAVEWDDVLILSLCTEWVGMYDMFKHYLLEPKSTARAEEYNGACMPGTSGYAIKPHAAKKLVDTYKNFYRPSDHAMANGLVKLQIHNQLMGRSKTEDEGKLSFTRRIWKI